MTDLERQRSPIAELLFLALPTIAQMASYTVMQFIDSLILSRLGETPATAGSNSGMLAFAMISLGMGTELLVNTLASQSFGRGEFGNCGRYLWQGIWVGLIFGLLLLPLRHIGGVLFPAFGHAPELAGMEATYWNIVLLAAAIKMVSIALGQFLLAIDRPKFVLFSAIVGVGINAPAAWMLVLGRGGFQSHGVAGAAWAQNIGVTCECATLAIFVFFTPGKFGVSNFAPHAKSMLTLLRIGVPSGLQWFSDVLAWSVFCNGVMGLLGTAAMAANTFMLRYLVVCFMPAVGLQSAATALVGRYIGRQRQDIVANRAHLAFGISLIYVIICGSVLVVARKPLIGLFSSNPDVIRMGAVYLIFAAAYEVFDVMYIVYTGALRGAGDTLVPTIVMASLCWTISIGGGYLVVLKVPQLGYTGPWIMGCIYGAVLGVYMLRRFLAGGWKSIQLHEPQPAVAH
jgi:multidrug resistance protein, MATE family